MIPSDVTLPDTRRPSVMRRVSLKPGSRPARPSMRHRNDYSHYYDNTQNSVVGQVRERPRVAVPAPFNQDWLIRHKLADVLHKIDGALGASHVGHVQYVVDPAACTARGRRVALLSDPTRHERSTSCPSGRPRRRATTRPRRRRRARLEPPWATPARRAGGGAGAGQDRPLSRVHRDYLISKHRQGVALYRQSGPLERDGYPCTPVLTARTCSAHHQAFGLIVLSVRCAPTGAHRPNVTAWSRVPARVPTLMTVPGTA